MSEAVERDGWEIDASIAEYMRGRYLRVTYDGISLDVDDGERLVARIPRWVLEALLGDTQQKRILALEAGIEDLAIHATWMPGLVRHAEQILGRGIEKAHLEEVHCAEPGQTEEKQGGEA